MAVPAMEPRKNATFPELVFHFLGTEDANTPDNAPTPEERSPLYGILGRRHHELLKHVKKCGKTRLKRAWDEWVRIGQYKNGDGQRKQLWANASSWMGRRKLYLELEKGVNGTEEEEEEFDLKWKKAGNKEVTEKRDWSQFEDFEIIYEPDYLDIRDPLYEAYSNKPNPDKTLGSKIFDLTSWDL